MNNIDEKDYVTLKVKELLVENGFSRKGPYIREGSHVLPSLYEAQKWVRENLNIHIVIDRSASGYYWTLCKADNGTFINNSEYCGPNDGGQWDSYEEALNAGIEAAILWKKS